MAHVNEDQEVYRMSTPSYNRRQFIQYSGLGALGIAGATFVAAGPATAAGNRSRTQITDLGPGITQFGLMMSLVVGDTLYIGSRNIEPTQVVAFHLPTRKVTAVKVVPGGYAIQAMTVDPTGGWLYIGVLQSGTTKPNLFRWDLNDLGQDVVQVGQTFNRDIRWLASAPDGVIYAVGGSGGAPALSEYNPVTGQMSNLGVPDSNSTLAAAVAADERTVFFGCGSVLNGGGSASGASLFAVDRATRAITRIQLPAEFDDDKEIRAVAVFGDELVVGGTATESAGFAIYDVNDLSTPKVALKSPRFNARAFTTDGTDIFYISAGGPMRYSRATGEITAVPTDGTPLGEIWGLGVQDRSLVTCSSQSFVAEVNIDTGHAVETDLSAAGAPVSAQLAMAVVAGGGYAYVGGNGTIARHDLATGEVVNIRQSGEMKSGLVVDGIAYMALYSGIGLHRYDPRVDDVPQKVASYPPGQNRSNEICWDDVNRRVIVGIHSDTLGGGSIVVYDPATGDSQAYINPIDAVASVSALASADGIVYAGGAGARGTVVALDPLTGVEKWRLDLQLTGGVTGLAVRDNHLYGICARGGFFVIDRDTRQVIHSTTHTPICPAQADLRVVRGAVYAVSSTTVFQLDPRTFAPRVILADTNAGIYGGLVNVGVDGGALYTMRERNLVKIIDQPVR